jgi:hypothetical protein
VVNKRLHWHEAAGGVIYIDVCRQGNVRRVPNDNKLDHFSQTRWKWLEDVQERTIIRLGSTHAHVPLTVLVLTFCKIRN